MRHMPWEERKERLTKAQVSWYDSRNTLGNRLLSTRQEYEAEAKNNRAYDDGANSQGGWSLNHHRL